jgi:GntR family transcriptional repressor for pyruvate dehydrogenase complex
VPVRNRVSGALEKKILLGQLNHGEVIPSERELAAEYGVGRASIREALRELGERGLIDIRPGKGTFVARPDSGKAVSGIALWATRSGVTPANILEARTGLESQAAFQAAKLSAEVSRQIIPAILSRLEIETDPSSVARLDVTFHLAIARLSANPLYELLLTSLAPLTADLVASTVGNDTIMKCRAVEHQEIAAAIFEGNSDEAKEAMIRHLSSGETNLPGYHQPMNAKGLIPDTSSLTSLLDELGLGPWPQQRSE